MATLINGHFKWLPKGIIKIAPLKNAFQKHTSKLLSQRYFLLVL